MSFNGMNRTLVEKSNTLTTDRIMQWYVTEYTVGGLSAPHQTSRLRHLSTLQWCWWDSRTSGVTLPSTLPGAAGVMAKSPLSKWPNTPMELPGKDRGGDPSLWPGMKERERVDMLLYNNEILLPLNLVLTFNKIYPQTLHRTCAISLPIRRASKRVAFMGNVCPSRWNTKIRCNMTQVMNHQKPTGLTQQLQNYTFEILTVTVQSKHGLGIHFHHHCEDQWMN